MFTELAAIADERGWEIKHSESTVTLRDRLSAAAVPGAAVATGIAAVLAYLKGRWS